MKKILIIEDDKSISKELYNLLIHSGYETEILEDFSNSKEEALKSRADLILLDINIPELNGEPLKRNTERIRCAGDYGNQ